MAFDIKLTPEANADIASICRYIAFELENAQAAQDFATDVFDAIFSLDEMPSRFPICPREPWRSRKTRYMGVKNYNVFYNVNEELGSVTILRVFYNRRNI